MRLVVVVGAAMFLEATLFGCLAPLLPDLTRELGLSKTEAGWLAAAFPIGIVVGAFPAGSFAARRGPKPAVIGGLVLMAAASVAFGVGHGMLVLEAARFATGLGSALVWGGGIAWLTATTPPDRRGTVIGRAVGIGIAGSICGPLVGGLAGLTSSVLVFAVLQPALLVALIAAASMLHGLPPPDDVPAARTLLTSRVKGTVALVMWLVAVPAAGTGVVVVLVPLRMSHFGAGSLAISLTFLLAAAAQSLASARSGRLSDRLGRRRPIWFALGIGALLLAAVPLWSSVLATATIVVVTMGVLTAAYAPAVALLTDATAAAGLPHGPDVSLFLLVWSGGWVVGSAVVSALAELGGDRLPFVAVAAALVATLAASRFAGARWTPAPEPGDQAG
jgi:MFS transporter, DHA1 family, solute carrier family 18 (vesicular amine transporter), member 1/2